MTHSTCYVSGKDVFDDVVIFSVTLLSRAGVNLISF